jgi:hypothetical protein
MSGSTGWLTLANVWAPSGAAAAIVTNTSTGQISANLVYANRSGSAVTVTLWRNSVADPHTIGQPFAIPAGGYATDENLTIGPSDTIYCLASAASAVALDISEYVLAA